MSAPDRPMAGAFAALLLFEKALEIDRVGGLATSALAPTRSGADIFQNGTVFMEGVVG